VPTSETPASALTYAEARVRSRLIGLRGYHVDLDLSGGQDTFGSVTDVRFGCREPGSASFIELRPARLRRAVLNGRELDPGTLHGNRLPLPGLRNANELRVEAEMAYSRVGAGLHRYTDAADGETYLALHAGLDNAQRVFAAFDQPDLKAAMTGTRRRSSPSPGPASTATWRSSPSHTPSIPTTRRSSLSSRPERWRTWATIVSCGTRIKSQISGG